MEKKSFSPPKLKKNKSKAPWAFPLAERKINPPPHAQIKLAWKVHCRLSKWTWTVHSPHQIQLEKKNLPSNLPPPPPRQKVAVSDSQQRDGVQPATSELPRCPSAWMTGWIQGKLHLTSQRPLIVSSILSSVATVHPDSGEASFYCPSGFRGGFILPLLYKARTGPAGTLPCPARPC